MNIYTYSQARQNLATLLEEAKSNGQIIIRRKDGSLFELKPIASKKSPLDVEGVDLNLTKDEISDILDEVRNR